MEKWNPLEIININASDTYKQIAIQSTKQQIKNILKSYVGYYDPFCELLQNAMDATDNRALNENNNNYTKKIIIRINLVENSIYVADNGIGFTEEKFRAFLSPNVTYKTDGHTRGNKGVGTTYLAYGFYKMEIYTCTPDFSQYAIICNARKWIDDKSSSTQMPYVEPQEYKDKNFDFDYGTSFKLYLSNDCGKKVKDLNWIGIHTANSWNKVLLTNTPLGHLTIDGSDSKVSYTLEVIDLENKSTKLENQKAEYFYPHMFIKNNTVNLSDVTKWQKSEIDKGKDSSKIPLKFKKKLGIYRYFTTGDIIDLARRSKTLSEMEFSLLGEYSVAAYGFFCNSVDRWTEFNEKEIGARKGVNCIMYGLQLAADNMIQGSTIQIPLTSKIGYQKQSQIIIHFNGAEPDLGRKGFQPELRSLAEKISSTIVSLALSNWKQLLAADGNPHNSDMEAKGLFEYILSMEDHAKTYPLNIVNNGFFLPTKKISILSEPISEQDVIVLFSQLLAGGVIRSIDLISTSSYNKYDGIFKIEVKEPIESNYYDQETNPLGVEKSKIHSLGIHTPPAFLEYKHSFDDLIQDFDNDDKNPNDIGLVVVWTMGKGRWKERFQALSYLLPAYESERPYHGITHDIYDIGISDHHVFYCIVLEELVLFLNNKEEYIKQFGPIYSED